MNQQYKSTLNFVFHQVLFFIAIQTPNQQSEVALSSTTMSSIDEKQTTKDYKEIPGKTVDKDALTSYEPSSY